MENGRAYAGNDEQKNEGGNMMNEQIALTKEEIAEVLTNYLDENIYNYAVMIDGEWGCGNSTDA